MLLGDGKKTADALVSKAMQLRSFGSGRWEQWEVKVEKGSDSNSTTGLYLWPVYTVVIFNFQRSFWCSELRWCNFGGVAQPTRDGSNKRNINCWALNRRGFRRLSKMRTPFPYTSHTIPKSKASLYRKYPKLFGMGVPLFQVLGVFPHYTLNFKSFISKLFCVAGAELLKKWQNIVEKIHWNPCFGTYKSFKWTFSKLKVVGHNWKSTMFHSSIQSACLTQQYSKADRSLPSSHQLGKRSFNNLSKIEVWNFLVT